MIESILVSFWDIVINDGLWNNCLPMSSFVIFYLSVILDLNLEQFISFCASSSSSFCFLFFVFVFRFVCVYVFLVPFGFLLWDQVF